MNISFSKKKLQKICNSEKKLRGEYGDRMSEKIQIRLFSLDEADSLEQLRGAPGRCHELTGDLVGHLALDLVHPMRLIFFPDHDPIPRTDEGTLIWERVTRVTIFDIRDYH